MKRRYIVLVLLMIMLFPLQAKAEEPTGKVTISCDKEIYKIDETAVCKVTGTTNGKVYGVDIILGDTISNLDMEFQKDSSWQGSGENGHIVLYEAKEKTGTFNIGTITLKVKEKNDFVSGTLYAVEEKSIFSSDTDTWKIESNTAYVNFMRDSDGSTTDNKKDNTTTNNSNSTKSDNTIKKTSNSVTNPNTGDHNIFITILVLIGTLGIFGVSYKKFKKVK